MRSSILTFVVAVAMCGVIGCTGGSDEITRPDTSDIEVKAMDPPPGAGSAGAETKALGAAPE